MTRLLAVLTATVALLVLPAAAVAKEVEKATVCGADGCTTESSTSDQHTIVTAVENGGPPTSPPPHRAAFYRVSVYMKGAAQAGEPPFRLLVVPGARRVRADGQWLAMDRFAYSAWRKVVRGVKPFPAAKLPGAVSAQPPGAGQLPPRTYAPALARPVSTPGEGTAWGLIGGIAAGSLALAAGAFALVVRRRRREPPGTPHTAPIS